MPLRIVMDMSTQWQIGPAGAVGLRLEVLPLMLRLHQVPRADWYEVTQSVQTIEREVLRLMRSRSSRP